MITRPPWLTFVGDVHGHINQYLRAIAPSTYSIQIGDLGLDYGALAHLDHEHHRFVSGDYDNCAATPPHALGDYGIWTIPGADGQLADIFFIRGAHGIDRLLRTEDADCLGAEELSEAEYEKANRLFANRRPEIVVSHDCPASVLPCFAAPCSGPSCTNRGLQDLLATHAPALWVFGHHHLSLGKRFGRTLFVCLGELACLDLDDHFCITAGPRGGQAPPIP